MPLEETFLPWGQRKGWEDVTPLPQDEKVTTHPIVTIDYTPEYSNTMDFVRALITKEEKSRRAHELVTEAIYMNPSNYTLWPYRRDILLALNDEKLFEKEFEFTEEIIEDSPKCYQVWGHRRWLVQTTGVFSNETKMLNRAIEADSKNYHAWSHRQWIVQEYSLWEPELKYLKETIEKDPRNNSAWNMRFFIYTNAPNLITLDEEVQYVFLMISMSPNNESPWNYLKGLMKKNPQIRPTIEKFCNLSREKWPVSPNPPRMLIHMFENCNDTIKSPSCEKCLDLCDLLATQLDTIRHKYWLYKKHQIKKSLNKP